VSGRSGLLLFGGAASSSGPCISFDLDLKYGVAIGRCVGIGDIDRFEKVDDACFEIER